MIEEKTAVLQKRESEGFGFVLRGAKGRNEGWMDGWVEKWWVFGGVGKKKKEGYLKQSLQRTSGETPHCCAVS